MRPMGQMRLMLRAAAALPARELHLKQTKTAAKKRGLQDRHETVDLLKGQGHQGRVLNGVLPNWTLRREALIDFSLEAKIYQRFAPFEIIGQQPLKDVTLILCFQSNKRGKQSTVCKKISVGSRAERMVEG
jgi:hypothetical protein